MRGHQKFNADAGARVATKNYLRGAQGKLHATLVSLPHSAEPRHAAKYAWKMNLLGGFQSAVHTVRPQCVKEEFERQRARWHLPAASDCNPQL